MKSLEAVADALSRANGYLEPESESYILRNPGMLRIPPNRVLYQSNTRERSREFNSEGIRVFNCHRAGYQALLDALQKRCANLPDSNLRQLLNAYGVMYSAPITAAIDFISRSLNDSLITVNTKLSYLTRSI